MTAEEKTTLARFLDLAADYLGDGYARSRAGYAFKDDAESNLPNEPESGEFSSLPLAYQVDEYADEAADESASRPLVMVVADDIDSVDQFLGKMLESIGLFRDKNCHIASCSPVLEQQITRLRPRVILCLGQAAAQCLLKNTQAFNALRGTFAEFTLGGRDAGETIPVLCTFHPGAILADESLKRPAWEDLKLLKSKLDLFNGE